MEDDPNDADFLKDAFCKIGYADAVRVAESVDLATEYFEKAERNGDGAAAPFPHLILLDLKLPGRSGLQLLEWLRRRPQTKYVPVVVLTSSTDHRDMIAAYEGGANSYTVKPVSKSDFVPMVEAIVHYWGVMNRIPSQL